MTRLMKLATNLVMAACLAGAASGCATVFASSTTAVTLGGQPGQPVAIDGQPVGQTPITVMVAARVPHTIQIGDRTCQLNPSIGAVWVVLDIVLGLFPLVVDAVTGAWIGTDASQCFMYGGAGYAPVMQPPPQGAAPGY